MVTLNQKLSERLTKEQRDILKHYVEEKNEIPIRVVYTQEYWDKIAKDAGYQLASREVAALQKSISRLGREISGKRINVIHLGVGIGFEAPIIIDGLAAGHLVNYSIVDVNPTMLEITENRLRQQYPTVRVKKFLVDIETYGVKKICEETKKGGADITVVCLVANGVLFSNDELVQEIFNSMDSADYFFLTLELYQAGKDEEIIKPYMIPSVLDLLSNGVRMIGYEPKYEEFSAEIDTNENLLKVYYSPSTDKQKRYLVLHSYKPNVHQLNERMGKFGFVRVFCKEYPEIHTSAALFKK